MYNNYMNTPDSESKLRETALCLLKERIKSGMPLVLEVVSDKSMSPLLAAGDTVAIKNTAFGELQRGDIVVFKINDALYAHRYLNRIEKDQPPLLLTKGDSVDNPDPCHVSQEKLFGKVIKIRKGCCEINLESKLWKANNALLAFLSLFQAGIFKFCRQVGKALLGNKDSHFISFMKKIISFSLSFGSKSFTILLIGLSCIIPKNTAKRQ